MNNLIVVPEKTISERMDKLRNEIIEGVTALGKNPYGRYHGFSQEIKQKINIFCDLQEQLIVELHNSYVTFEPEAYVHD